jgi:hypothetical protein
MGRCNMKKEEIMKKIDKLYIARKRKQNPYKAPEDLPDGVQSDQIKAVIEVFSELLESLTENGVVHIPIERLNEYKEAEKNGTLDEFLKKYITNKK